MSTGMDLYYRHIEEHVIPGKRLGRHVLHDPRSLNFLVPAGATPILARTWRRYTPILDQGNLGSCTGNAAAGVLGSAPFYGSLAARRKAGLTLDEREAVSLYSSATHLDPFSGSYPPTDTGSNGLSVAKAALKAGLISSYRHATSLLAMQTALQTGPVCIGINWYDSFDAPNPNTGRVSISPNAVVRGGHEVEVRVLDTRDRLFRLSNSWTPGWGINGEATFSWDDMDRLLHEQGDCTQFVPLGATAPTVKAGLLTRLRERFCA